MKNKTLYILILILLILLSFVYLKPYNSLEFNAATIYYQSYLQFYNNLDEYVELLEKYNNSKDNTYLEYALIELENIKDNLRIFKLASQIDYRDTIINQKVVKSDIFSLKTLEDIQISLEISQNMLRQYLEDSALRDATFEDLVYYNQLIRDGLYADSIGYDEQKKEFAVHIDNGNLSILEEAFLGLKEISKDVE